MYCPPNHKMHAGENQWRRETTDVFGVALRLMVTKTKEVYTIVGTHSVGQSMIAMPQVCLNQWSMNLNKMQSVILFSCIATTAPPPLPHS